MESTRKTRSCIRGCGRVSVPCPRARGGRIGARSHHTLCTVVELRIVPVKMAFELHNHVLRFTGRALAKPAQSRCHSFGRLLRLLAVRRARAANSKTSICALDHVAALPRLLSNDEADALADCTACSSCLVSVLSMSSEWWRCVSGYRVALGTGLSRSPRRSGIRLALGAEIATRISQGVS